MIKLILKPYAAGVSRPKGKTHSISISASVNQARSSIRRGEGVCSTCGAETANPWMTVRRESGREERVLMASMGADGRCEDYIYLQLIERVWKRPAAAIDTLAGIPQNRRPSSRASIVLLSWTYLETRIERLLRAIYCEVPAPLVEDTLTRYASIGARLDRLYRVACGSTYFGDLRELGFGDVANHLAHVQQRRNAFTHGDPHAIDDDLVLAVVEKMKREHEAWIAVFNRRAARRRRAP